MDVQLRTYAFIDSMQPQAAAHVASTCQGDVPTAGMSELFIEVAPGNEIFRCADIALKAADVRPALQIIEREFGLLEIHSRTQSEVLALFRCLSREMGLAILYISHDLLSVSTIADRIAVMHRGEIVECRGAHAIFTDPQDPYTRSLIAALPSVPVIPSEEFLGETLVKSHAVGASRSRVHHHVRS